MHGRYETLRKAIDAPEDADLSHLSVSKAWLSISDVAEEVDRKIVEICRKVPRG